MNPIYQQTDKNHLADRLPLAWAALWLLLALVWASSSAKAQSLTSANPRPLVEAVDSVGLTVSDLDRSTEFFTKVLRASARAFRLAYARGAAASGRRIY
jgi:hypothetical protein